MLVKANVRCFVNDSIREEGDIFEYSGMPCDTVTEVEKTKGKRSKPEQDLTDTE